HAAPLSFEAITRRERAPERLIESEPLVSIADDGKVTIVWETVIPVRSAGIYVGLLNNEISLNYPVYSWSITVREQAFGTHHSATFDLTALPQAISHGSRQRAGRNCLSHRDIRSAQACDPFHRSAVSLCV